MADDTITDMTTGTLIPVPDKLGKPVDQPQPEPAAEPASAVDRLRAFEDKHFGEKAVRINGRIERGSGSPYQMAHPSVRKQHQALERLIEAEQHLADAHAALIAADEGHERAEQDVAAAEKEADAPADE